MLRRILALAAVAVLMTATASASPTTDQHVTDARAAVDVLADDIAALETDNAALAAQVATLTTERDALRAQVADLEAQLAAAACDAQVSGGSLQAALDAAGADATVCLSGTFTVSNPVRPLAGQTLKGPAAIVGSGMTVNEDALDLPADVTLVDLDVSGAGRHGVGCWYGTTVRGGRLHHNGKDGMGCDLDGRVSDVLVDGVEIDHNGTDPSWLGNSAGIKWFHAHGVTITASHVHDNVGNGVWCDAQCGDFTVTDSVIERNTRKGVFYEKGGASDGSWGGRTWAVYEGSLTVTGNVIVDNDLEGKPSAHAGVAIYSSKNALVAGNTFGGSLRAVIAREDAARLTDDKHGWPLSNIVIRDNVLNGTEVVGCGSSGVTCSGNV